MEGYSRKTSWCHLVHLCKIYQFLKTAKDIANFLRDVPGPSPWYLTSQGPQFAEMGVAWLDASAYLKKHKVNLGANSTGKTFLLINSSLKMIFDFQCYVQKVGTNNILVWYEQTNESASIADVKIVIHLFAIADLNSIVDVNYAVGKINSCNKVYWEGETSGKLEIPKNLEEGSHMFAAPDSMRNLSELLILGISTAHGLVSNYFDKMSLALFAVNFEKQTLRITLQDWFNQGNYDFMYQWPTRLKRQPETEAIFGDGIRIKPFMLDNSSKKIANWFDH